MARTVLTPTAVDRVGRQISLGLPDDDDKYKTSVAMANGAYALDALLPGDTRAHTVTLTHVLTAGVDTLGTITVVGTDYKGASLTEILTPVDSSVVTSSGYFLSIVSCTQAGWVVNAGADMIEIGFGAALEAPVAGTSDGHEFFNDGRCILLIDNITDITAGDDRNISIATPGSVLGLAISELIVSCLKGQTTVLGPFPIALFNQTDNLVDIDFPAGGDELDLEVHVLRI